MAGTDSPEAFMKEYVIQSASVIGSHHRSVNKNNQDAVVVVENDEITVGIVADGCGSGAHSEVGARLGALFAANFLASRAGQSTDFAALLEELKRELLAYLGTICSTGVEKTEFVFSHLLFTLVGFVITSDKVCVFRAGDGVAIVNDEKLVFDENNMPRYLSFGLLREEKDDKGAPASTRLSNRGERFGFEIVKEMARDELNCLLVATDGFQEIFENSEQEFTLLGEVKTVGSFIDLSNSKYLHNKSFLQKRLNVIGVNQGLLYDDTTAILVKSQNAESQVKSPKCKV